MAGVVTLQVDVIKDGVRKFNTKMPFFLPSPVDPVYSEKIVFEGIGVDLYQNGRQGNMDATLATKVAVRETMTYLQGLGYTQEQAYLLLSAVSAKGPDPALVLLFPAFCGETAACAKHDYEVRTKLLTLLFPLYVWTCNHDLWLLGA